MSTEDGAVSSCQEAGESDRQCPSKWVLKDNQGFSRHGTGERSFYREGQHVQNYRVMRVIGDENTYLLLLIHVYSVILPSRGTPLKSYVTGSDILRQMISGGMEGRVQIFHSTSQDGVGVQLPQIGESFRSQSFIRLDVYLQSCKTLRLSASLYPAAMEGPT